MSTITVYTFTDAEDNEATGYTTQDSGEADRYGRAHGYKVIGLDYEYSDRSLVADYSTPTPRAVLLAVVQEITDHPDRSDALFIRPSAFQLRELAEANDRVLSEDETDRYAVAVADLIVDAHNAALPRAIRRDRWTELAALAEDAS